jgi:hypothetical protein
VDSKNYCVTLSEWYNFWTRLHAWTLFSKHEFSTYKVMLWFRQKNRKLKRKDMLAVQVLMKAVVIVFAILKKKWCRLELASIMAARDKI